MKLIMASKIMARNFAQLACNYVCGLNDNLVNIE